MSEQRWAWLLGLTLLIYGSPIQKDRSQLKLFVVWNVGQGLWTSTIHPNECIHIDFGGEFAREGARPRQMCAGRFQRIFLTHPDRDHYNFLSQVLEISSEFCATPLVKKVLAERLKIRSRSPLCSASEKLEQLFSGSGRETNSQSRVFVLQNKILIPGDSSQKEEKIWISNLHQPIAVLVLGHHGSRTATSEPLLNRLPHLKMAIASARKKRYGHPHAEVVRRLNQRGIAVLRTEVWGSIGIEIK